MIFLDIVKYNKDSNFIESFLENQYNDRPNYVRILEIINPTNINNHKNNK